MKVGSFCLMLIKHVLRHDENIPAADEGRAVKRVLQPTNQLIYLLTLCRQELVCEIGVQSNQSDSPMRE